MALTLADHALLQRTVTLAESAIGLSEPNPRVGCVLHDAQGRFAGEGFTQQAGAAHAEVMALRDAAGRGHDEAGGTAWVSLEPCAHQGRTPPCADALVNAGVARVVAALVRIVAMTCVIDANHLTERHHTAHAVRRATRLLHVK